MTDMKEAIVWLFMALVLGCILAAGIVWTIKSVEAAERPYTVYRIPLGCLYIVGATNPAMLYVPDQTDKPCDGALKGVK